MQSEAWSKQKDRKSKRQERKDKKQRKKVKKQEQATLSGKRSHEEVDEDLDDLEKDMRLIKKLKKGKVRTSTLLALMGHSWACSMVTV